MIDEKLLTPDELLEKWKAEDLSALPEGGTFAVEKEPAPISLESVKEVVFSGEITESELKALDWGVMPLPVEESSDEFRFSVQWHMVPLKHFSPMAITLPVDIQEEDKSHD
jgi:hypothetical protein